MKTVLQYLLAVFLVGCAAPASNLNRLSVGMTKADVLQIMGQPQSVSAKAGNEYLLYRLGEGLQTRHSPDGTPMTGQATSLYFVQLTDGRVVSYGRVGDFDSTKIPEAKHTIDVNINK